MDKWQYLRVLNPSDDKLGDLGQMGWELVAVYHDPDPAKDYIVYVFKKRME
jgi:hypothetical protein